MHIIYVDPNKSDQRRFAELSSTLINIRHCAVLSSAQEAFDYVNTEKVDAAFIEIPMAQNAELLMARELRKLHIPFIFVSSEKASASEAFDMQAVHFLVKPLSAEDIRRGIARSEQFIEKLYLEQLSTKISHIIRDQQPATAPKWLMIKSRNKFSLVEYSQIVYLEGAGAYTHIHTQDKKKYTTSRLIGSHEKELNSDFIRIHKSYIVNRNFIQTVKFSEHKSTVLLKTNVELEMSSKLRDKIVQLIFHETHI